MGGVLVDFSSVANSGWATTGGGGGPVVDAVVAIEEEEEEEEEEGGGGGADGRAVVVRVPLGKRIMVAGTGSGTGTRETSPAATKSSRCEARTEET